MAELKQRENKTWIRGVAGYFGIVLASLLWVMSAMASTANRTALVIGNSAYSDAPLANPVADAQAVARTLRQLNFEVLLATDADQQQMEREIYHFEETLRRKGGVGLFYYAGHGIQSHGRNYLIPVKAEIVKEWDLKFKAVDVGQVSSAMEGAGNGLNMIVLDACRNNPLVRSFRGAERGLARMADTPNGLLLAYSTSPGAVAQDGKGAHSPYAQAFMDTIVKPDQHVLLAFQEISRQLKTESGGGQVPWVSSSLTGNFYFNPQKVAETESSPVPQLTVTPVIQPTNELLALSAQDEAARAAWEVVKNGEDITLIDAFLQRFPNSPYSFAAELKRQQLSGSGASGSTSGSTASDGTYPLTIHPEPADAQVRILNISPKYQPGMLLQPGPYHVEVSKPGFAPVRRWVTLQQAPLVETMALGDAGYPVTLVANVDGVQYRLKADGRRFTSGQALPTGRHQIEAAHKGYQSKTVEVAVFTEPVSLKVELSPQTHPLLEKLGFNFIEVPAGEFYMGENTGDSDEKPVHKVTIAKPFKMMSTELTWEHYTPCVEDNFCYNGSDQGWGRGKRPVINVSWEDTQSYIEWLRQKTGMRFRLPTEAEWEYAARAGSRTKYAWGNEPSGQHANGDEDDGWPADGYKKQTAPVGSYTANPWGFYDLHGNVWEWVQDCYHGSYQGAPADGSAWEGENCYGRVLRGGSWYSKPSTLRSATRGTNSPGNRYSNNGFRLVQDLD